MLYNQVEARNRCWRCKRRACTRLNVSCRVNSHIKLIYNLVGGVGLLRVKQSIRDPDFNCLDGREGSVSWTSLYLDSRVGICLDCSAVSKKRCIKWIWSEWSPVKERHIIVNLNEVAQIRACWRTFSYAWFNWCNCYGRSCTHVSVFASRSGRVCHGKCSIYTRVLDRDEERVLNYALIRCTKRILSRVPHLVNILSSRVCPKLRNVCTAHREAKCERYKSSRFDAWGARRTYNSICKVVCWGNCSPGGGGW